MQRIIREDETIEFDAIPNDSQWRDALVLYCEVAPFEKAQAIANFAGILLKLLIILRIYGLFIV